MIGVWWKALCRYCVQCGWGGGCSVNYICWWFPWGQIYDTGDTLMTRVNFGVPNTESLIMKTFDIWQCWTIFVFNMEQFLSPLIILIFNWICEKFFLIRVWIQTLNGKLCNLILLSKVNISKTLFCLSSGLKHQILHYTRYQEASHTRAGVGVTNNVHEKDTLM